MLGLFLLALRGFLSTCVPGRNLEYYLRLGTLCRSLFPLLRQAQQALAVIDAEVGESPAEQGEYYLKVRPAQAGQLVVNQCPERRVMEKQLTATVKKTTQPVGDAAGAISR